MTADAELSFEPRVRTKRRVGRWLMPVPALVTLLRPFDLAPIMFAWLIAFGMALLGAILLLGVVLRLLAGQRDGMLSLSAGPIAAIALFAGSVASANLSFERATDFGRDAADRIQKRCHAETACPDRIAGWDAGVVGQSQTLVGWPGRRYWVTYVVSDDRRRFSIRVRRSLDIGRMFSGGADVTAISAGADRD